jgi:hypothetical protein
MGERPDQPVPAAETRSLSAEVHFIAFAMHTFPRPADYSWILANAQNPIWKYPQRPCNRVPLTSGSIDTIFK